MKRLSSLLIMMLSMLFSYNAQGANCSFLSNQYFKDFKLTLVKGDIIITLQDLNNDFLYKVTVQKCATGVDFFDLATKTLDESFDESELAIKDDTPFYGLNYYRIKIEDIDNNEYYSSIKAIRMLDSADTDVSVYPNPSNGQVVFLKGKLSSNEKPFAIEAYNMLGELVLQTEVTSSAFLHNSIEITLGGKLKPGRYFLVGGPPEQKFRKPFIVN